MIRLAIPTPELLILASTLGGLHCASSPAPRTQHTSADIIATYEIGRTRETDFRDYWIGSTKEQVEERAKRVAALKDYGVLGVSSRTKGTDEQRVYSIGTLRKRGEESVQQRQLFPIEEGAAARGAEHYAHTKAGDPAASRPPPPRSAEKSDLTLRHLEPLVVWVLVFTNGVLDSLYAPERRPPLLP
jgi:hypothetical protein